MIWFFRLMPILLTFFCIWRCSRQINSDVFWFSDSTLHQSTNLGIPCSPIDGRTESTEWCRVYIIQLTYLRQMELEYLLLKNTVEPHCEWYIYKKKKKKGNDVNTYLMFVFMVAIFTKWMHDIFLLYFSNIRHFLWWVSNCYYPDNTPYTWYKA